MEKPVRNSDNDVDEWRIIPGFFPKANVRSAQVVQRIGLMDGHVPCRRLGIAREPNAIHGPQTTGQKKDNSDFFNIHRAQNSKLKSRTAIATTNRQTRKSKARLATADRQTRKQGSNCPCKS